ncbi:unnamed protein product [Soboliphyme baturini]|uniref:EH domain-containing protein n=1 Tax=Soboliphyme baturini TaxID=241478 RepID=A0A183ICM7_9BILA|nr:unnamed protein product [Soboliphyme baturini]
MGQTHSTEDVLKLEEPSALGLDAALKKYYERKVLPLEKVSNFEYFYSPSLTSGELSSVPCLLLIGQYSVGKTSFIRYLMNGDYPGMRIGPEPTTDDFVVIQYGDNPRRIPGVTAISQENFPLKGLEKFSDKFLRKCITAFCPNDLLRHMMIIDTPGILSGEKQRINRGYDFEGVVQYLSDKADIILLMFDAQKLDISDELKRVIAGLQRNEEKIKIILNKADSCDPTSLNRVRGALMWSLGRTMQRPEVPVLYTGSFWDQPLTHAQYQETFDADRKELFDDFRKLPRTVYVRRLNDIVKRAKQVRLHSLLMNELCKRKWCTLKRLALRRFRTHTYPYFVDKHNLSTYDLLPVVEYIDRLKKLDKKLWKTADQGKLKKIEEFLSDDITKMMNILPSEKAIQLAKSGRLQPQQMPVGAAKESNADWQVIANLAKMEGWAREFSELSPRNGFVDLSKVQPLIDNCHLPWTTSDHIVKLVDCDNDQKITEKEFFLLKWLLGLGIAGKEIPDKLSSSQRPPKDDGY